MNKAKGRVFAERRRYREGVFLLCGVFYAEDMMRYQQYLFRSGSRIYLRGAICPACSQWMGSWEMGRAFEQQEPLLYN